MFKNILLPFSSEFYPEQILDRSVFFARIFESKIHLLYIIEEKTLYKADKIIDSYLSTYYINETKNQIIQKHRKTADNIIFEDAKITFQNKGIIFDDKILQGEFSDVIKNEIRTGFYDLVLMGFEKQCNLNYRLLEKLDIPIWVESKSDSKTILAVCSNLAPNQKVPNISIEISRAFGWNIKMLYVIDTEDNVKVDENGIRSDRKKETELDIEAQDFVKKMSKYNINVEIVKGSLEKETIKKAEEINANLVIVGREQKKKGLLRLPVKNIKKKIVEKCEYSLLFIN
jgi:nucleotide-binding universal stress UspA family protein